MFKVQGMNTKFTLLLTLTILTSSGAFAETNNCNSIKQESPGGTRCHTSKGFEFIRVPFGWEDQTSGKTWYNEVIKDISQYGAKKFCSDIRGLALPSKSDFELAESHGIREVLKDMNEDCPHRAFWSSTIYSNNSNYAYLFNGCLGSIDFMHRRTNAFVPAVRCVSP